MGTLINLNYDNINLQFELVGELFAGLLTWRRRGMGMSINHNCDDINLQFELVGELFADMASEGDGNVD